MNCPTGDFLTIWHNNLHGFTASLLSEVCFNVSVEPQLQSLTEETFPPLTSANVEDDTCVDVAASRFWVSRHQKIFLHRCKSLNKQRKYEQRIC